jgi:predicted transcriptional regulator
MSSEEKDLVLAVVKKTLADRGIKQSWLALQIGVANSTLSLYLKGKGGLGIDKIEKLNEIIKRLGAAQ